MPSKQLIALPETDFELPAGFRWGTAAASVKYAGRDDIALVESMKPAACAAVFTQNTFAAAPVIVSREILHASAGIIGGIVTNSGCANAATGEQGLADARKMSRVAACRCGDSCQFLVCSTGTIGVTLPMERIEPGIKSAGESLESTREAFVKFANAILTTDTHHKIASKEIHIGGKPVRIVACAKGSGMLNPLMATMLAYVMTDIQIEPTSLGKTFVEAIDRSLNCLTVDGDTSTNDTAIILANGESGVTVEPGTVEVREFQAALTGVLQSLAQQLARDGEGATKLIEVTVRNTPSFLEARTAALSVANSPLVKTAIYGNDANWGRIACALGNSGIEFDPAKTDISMGAISLLRQGAPVEFNEEQAAAMLAQERITIDADLHAGMESATVWTCDLTEEYIKINGSYRT